MRPPLSSYCVLSFALVGCGFSFDVKDQCFQGDPCATPDLGQSDLGGVDTAAPDTGPNEDLNVTGDDDGDKVANGGDNCRTTYNPGQLDYDADGRGDECDVCPFLPGGEAATNADCYADWDEDQLDGEWAGYAVIAPPPSGDLIPVKSAFGVQSFASTFAGSKHTTGAAGGEKALNVGPGGVLVLEDFAEKGGALDSRMDAVLTVDRRREVAIGHLVTRGGGGGRAAPPNFLVLVRKRRIEGLADQPVAETRLPPGKPLKREWFLYGWIDFDGLLESLTTRQTAQGRFSTAVVDQKLQIVGYEESGKQDGFLWLFDSDSEGDEESGSPQVQFETGGTLNETAEGFTLSVDVKAKGSGLSGATFEALDLTGQLGMSRDVAVLSGEFTSKDRQIRAFLLMVERSTKAEREEAAGAAPWALAGVHRDASVLGLVAPAALSGNVGLQFHGADLSVSAGGGEASSGFEGDDFVGLNVPATFSSPLENTLGNPRVCVFPAIGGSLGLFVACPSSQIAAKDGCALERSCAVPVGLALRADATHPVNDADLDGKGDATQPGASEFCAPTDADPCPCVINPFSGCSP